MSMRKLIDEAVHSAGLTEGAMGPLDGGVTKTKISKMADAMMSPRLMAEIKRIAKVLEKNDDQAAPDRSLDQFKSASNAGVDWEEKLYRDVRERAVDAIVVALTINGIKTTTTLKTAARKSSRATSKGLR